MARASSERPLKAKEEVRGATRSRRRTEMARFSLQADFQPAGDQPTAIADLERYGRVTMNWRGSDLVDGTERLQEALGVAQRIGARRLAGRAQANLGLLLCARLELDAGRRHLEEALELNREVGGPYAVEAAQRQGQVDDAVIAIGVALYASSPDRGLIVSPARGRERHQPVVAGKHHGLGHLVAVAQGQATAPEPTA